METWSPTSWTSKPAKQCVAYEDTEATEAALEKLRKLPPLVTTQEVANLKNSLRNVALGKAFVLQGGDCAELFDYCNQEMIEAKVKLLLQMSLVLIWGANKPVVRIARIAGQFAKPRSSPMETINGVEMPSFRGDNINGFEATPESRKPDPSRLVSAYFHSAATLNYLRASLSSGLADLHSPLDWGLGHVITPAIKEKYERIVSRVKDALRFMQTVGIDTDRGVETVDVYTSHEGLLLDYETSLTRLLRNPLPPNSAPAFSMFSPPSFSQPPPSAVDPTTSTTTAPATATATSITPQTPLLPSKSFYATSAHFLWIGDRTRQLDGAHVEFFRGLANPIGIKIGPSMTPEELTQLLDVVNPTREIGKVTLISRYGAAKIASHLPGHIEAVQRAGHLPVWQCDPMHGNTQSTPTGIKTRHFSDILSELRQALEIHRAHGSFLGGMHLELTGEAVTECVGGAGGLTEEGLGERYTTFCDPRLNEKQALELAFLVAGFYREMDESERGRMNSI
ncbi:3-deoxy-7-phosphoheptulonate synthase class II [Aspergillus brunneoviolaceus CBS 621.78]|uniref:Phospho-2-dehydro-3-deoxyheptonate aldolase, class II n=1 Tax=Aspergillus brunneoviolaceus CBS 621.78 TaxID=1450534 RepID=A0ACD1GQ62_9EURO|nr:phospho-2-dehydro-3-deoxyheptonate aldolase, class II [Aspergillus brunneoviolaceus CBS 621.78]RAH51433.1 phospho-2-dehydro-3-deoxyheptonate aldolase, class II [Aspergillus brunneoviolaceus CBS 621.78]